MSELALYSTYEREEVIALFGPASEARVTCNGQWVLFPTHSICLAVVGPSASYFSASSKVVWVSGEQYRGRGPTGFVPIAVQGGDAERTPIHLFVRKRESSTYLYLGELSPTYAIRHATRGSAGQADFDLSPALPSSVWHDLDGFDPGDLNHRALDNSLDRLRAPTSLAERMEVVKHVVEYWYGSVRPGDGFSDDELAGLRLPTALREWYRWAGKRTEILSGQTTS